MLENLLFWGLDVDTGEFDKTLKTVLDKIEPPNLWTIQQTEPDVIVIGKKTLVFNESKIGKPGIIDAWNRKDKFSDKHELYRKNAKRYFKKPFIDDFNVEGGRYYQLMRNYIVGAHLASRLNKEFYLVALVKKEIPISQRAGVVNAIFRVNPPAAEDWASVAVTTSGASMPSG